MQILGEPFDYNLLMGLSGHAFRLMIYKSGVYIEPPHDGEGYYFRYHALPALGYEQRIYHDPHGDSGYSPEETAQAI